MRKSGKKIEGPAKRRGRPPGTGPGESPIVQIRLPATLMARLDRYCAAEDVTRSEAVRSVLDRALPD